MRQPHAVALRAGYQADQAEVVMAPAVPLPSLWVSSLRNSHCVWDSFLRRLIFGVLELPQIRQTSVKPILLAALMLRTELPATLRTKTGAIRATERLHRQSQGAILTCGLAQVENMPLVDGELGGILW